MMLGINNVLFSNAIESELKPIYEFNYDTWV